MGQGKRHSATTMGKSKCLSVSFGLDNFQKGEGPQVGNSQFKTLMPIK